MTSSVSPSVVWIDLDDTLWDFKANSRVALTGIYNDYKLNRWFASASHWIECYERHNHELWNQYNHALISKEYLMQQRFLRPLLEAGSDEAEALAAFFDHHYLDRLAECTLLVDGALDLLGKLHDRGYRIGILSNGFTEVQHRKIKNSGLSPYIDYIVLSDDIGVNKPDVRIFRHAEEVSGCDAGHSIMVGDNPDTDIKGAVDAGWSAILFSRDNAGVPTTGPIATALGDILTLLPVQFAAEL